MNIIQPQVIITSIDFAQTALAGTYNPFYAKVIDNLFTPEDCARLLDLASSKDAWKPAGLSAQTERAVYTDFRHNDNILVIDKDQAAWIYEKLRPYVEEIHEISPEGRWSGITSRPGKKQATTPTWTLAGVHPRLSFLRYGPGHYFKPHCDGLNDLGASKSFVTLHLYLNDSAQASTPIMLDTSTASSPSLPSSVSSGLTPIPQSDASIPTSSGIEGEHSPAAGVSLGDVPLRGGSTRFWTPNKKAFLDVHPKLGRVLVFQQRMLIHSGEEVTQGIKYTMRSDFIFTEKVHT
ncbi:hypothetical protein C0991_008022 [Blastosporella zonata]|nr:hypothetical protein C0991_008022 [Blastosporella zonata]